MDPFDDPDITILTNDGDASWAVWQMSHAAEEAGDTSFQVAERMQKALTLDRVHEVWIILNDALASASVVLGLYGAFKALKPKDGRRITIRFGAHVKVSRDDRERLESLGIDLAFEKTEKEHSVRSDSERQFQEWVRQNVHNIPGLHDAEGLDAEVARLRVKIERDLPNLIPQIEEEVGDLDDALRTAYESVHDPELGFKD